MAVTVAEFEGLDAPDARLDGIAECQGTALAKAASPSCFQAR